MKKRRILLLGSGILVYLSMISASLPVSAAENNVAYAVEDAAAFSTAPVAEATVNGWQQISNSWYWFESGTAATGWRQLNGNWYYLHENGTMATGWYSVNGHWYYSEEGGAMLTGWRYINGYWYYLSEGGAMLTGWQYINGHWYYLSEGGAMLTGWQYINDHWYYLSEGGAMLTGWQYINGYWYYLSGSGVMLTGWQHINGHWYYLSEGGAMLTGWQYIDGNWYFVNAGGAMAANTWIDGTYYVTGSGAMAVDTWIDSWYVGADGKWIPDYTATTEGTWEEFNGTWYFKLNSGTYLANCWRKISGGWFYFEPDGKMVTGWKYIDGYKYYFAESGRLVQDLDEIIGIQPSYYITVNRAKCQITVWAKDGENGYIIPAKTFVCSVGLSNSTPIGTYFTPAKYRWQTLLGPTYGQYCTRITGHILFHSVAGYNMTSYNLKASDYNKLGSPASHGCIRLTVRDAKWIYDNCPLGTTVTISDTAYMPFDKPVSIKIPEGQNWDPTDPNL